MLVPLRVMVPELEKTMLLAAGTVGVMPPVMMRLPLPAMVPGVAVLVELKAATFNTELESGRAFTVVIEVA